MADVRIGAIIFDCHDPLKVAEADRIVALGPGGCGDPPIPGTRSSSWETRS